MQSNLLDIISNENGNWYFENGAEAIIYAVIGYLIVFVGILLIIGIIWLVGFLLKKTNNFAFVGRWKKKVSEGIKGIFKRKDSQKAEKENKYFDDFEMIEEPQAEVAEKEIPDAVKAAIVAAIMAYYEQEQPQCEFVVKRIKRI